MAWISEATLPFTPLTTMYFSPIRNRGVFLIDRGKALYYYSLSGGNFSLLADPADSAQDTNRQLALSPGGTILYCPSLGSDYGGGIKLSSYHIPSNTWVGNSLTPYDQRSLGYENLVLTFSVGETVTGGTSGATGEVESDSGSSLTVLPLSATDFEVGEQITGGTSGATADITSVTGGERYVLKSLVAVAENDIRCFCQRRTNDLRCLKYNLGTDTWTVSSGSLGSTYQARGATVNSAGTIVYTGGTTTYVKYTIATDSYAESSARSGYSYAFVADSDKLWYYNNTTFRLGYLDPADDSFNDDQFEENTDRDAGYGSQNGISDDLEYVIAWAKSTNPYMMSTTSGGTPSGLLPAVETLLMTAIAETTATGNGDLTAIGDPAPTQHGHCWSTSAFPTTADSKTSLGFKGENGLFSSSLTGLTAGTTYHCRAYATNSVGTVYGEDITFITQVAGSPSVTTQACTTVSTTTATGNGNITDIGDSSVTEHGHCWSKTPNPTTSDSKTTNGAGSAGAFTSSITGLSQDTYYYVRAYATNTQGTGYGDNVIMHTLIANAPTVTTQAVSNISKHTATGNGNVTNLGTPNPTAHGHVWSKSPHPSLYDYENKTDNGAKSATGAFTSAMFGLNGGTLYYVRAYATNSAGTGYGNEVEFTTLTYGGNPQVIIID